MNTPTEVPVDTKPQAMLVEHADAVLTDQVPQNAAESGVDHSIAHAHGRDPSLHPDHPTNSLSNKRKWAVLLTLSWAGFVANYSASAHLTAFEPMSLYFGVPVAKIANTIGYSLLGVAVGPLIWNPLSKTIGRRPTYLIGSALFIPCVIWMALSRNYNSFVLARLFAGLTSSFSQTVPPSTIADMFRKEVRGDRMSVFGLFVVIAPAISPFFGGLLVQNHPWQYIYWLTLAFAGLQFILFFFIVPETLWIEHESDQDGKTGAELSRQRTEDIARGKDTDDEYDLDSAPKGGRRGAAWMPWHRPSEYMRLTTSPILMSRFLPITIVSFYYGTLFAWSVGITIVMPQVLFPPPYSFSNIAVGASYLAYGVGSVLGKSLGGVVGDKVMMYFARRNGGRREPEYRLYALIPLLPIMFAGEFIVGITIQKQLHWIAPLIGGAIFYVGFVTATGILQTYVLECYITKSMDTQAIFVFWKMLWGFAVPFFAYQWAIATSFTAAYAIQGALAAVMGGIVCVGLIWKGYEIRKWQGMPVSNWGQ